MPPGKAYPINLMTSIGAYPEKSDVKANHPYIHVSELLLIACFYFKHFLHVMHPNFG